MSILILIFIIKVLINLQPISSSGHNNSHYVHFDCSRSDFTYTSGSTFEANLTNTLLNILPANASLAGFSEITTGEEGADQVNALFFCRGDIRGSDCHDCIEAAARTIIQRCQFLKEGIVWYQECTLRYSNQSAMMSVEELEVVPNHPDFNFSGHFRFLEQHEIIFNNLMNRLIHEAAFVGNATGFATGESNLSTTDWTLRGLVQCRPDLGGRHCESCLRQALRQRVGWNTPMVFLPSCNIRFDLYPHPNINSPSPENDGIPLKVLVPVVAVCVLVLCCTIFFVIRHCRRWWHPPDQHEQDDHPRDYTYMELLWATDCFSKKRILGKGGFGNVYKGTLRDDTLVAIKRLNIQGSLQGHKEFVAEIAAITNLKHENVVSLKGYCMFLRERLLVYEYVPNKTLEHHLHGDDQELSWEKRMRTAQTLAEVFAFLHERNPIIIHRDIKPSNILFDTEFHPKVGDFGIAKLVPESQTHMTTMIRGSHGYLDPYYYTSECLTRKSDVYAFGVVLLELITGRKANFIAEESDEGRSHITVWVEPLIKEALLTGRFDALVDRKLGADYNRDEMNRMVICAATCVRMPEERPTMRQVAEYLKQSSESRQSSTQFKERLMGFWQNEDQRRLFGQDVLSSSPRMVGQISNGYSDTESQSTSYDSFRITESHDLHLNLSPTHHFT
ncbi:proline-rich receptor-like protein kinase PERK15 [Beta vulgaris subsp. vulgaris]|uniref:proline-rich receptor-like protein kinase PERK15 n=1 Tax=Beta vulgaris subsp. vulgaris TaxID=3555 RepID=UPI0020372C64|nr:proline-rich receptor-like protein kinase PERK15 [Beta vulgaris subsp. vulgaris]